MTPRRRRLAPACATLALIGGCALPQESKTFHLSRHDWAGTALSIRGHITAADAVAGAAPNTITVLNIGALETAPPGPLERIRTQEARAQALTAALQRRGVSPADIAVQARAADAAEPLWLPSKPMVIVVRY